MNAIFDFIEEQPPFYIAGGALPVNAPCYVPRAADEALFRHLTQGTFCYIFDTRQVGKSSLMVRTARRLRAAGHPTAVADPTAIGRNPTPLQWYNGLLSQIGAQFDDGGETEDALFAAWQSTAARPPAERFFHALHQTFASTPGVTLFIDEIDATRSLPFPTDDFFAGIRTLRDLAPSPNFCLLGVATPTDLIADPARSPFPLGQRIELSDFSLADISVHLNPPAPDRFPETILQRVLHWTDGHPYLTQRLLLALYESPARERPTTATVDRLCDTLFLNPSAREIEDNLAFVRNRLLHGYHDLPAVLTLFRQISEGAHIPANPTDPLHTALQLIGIAKPDASGHLTPRNRIYLQTILPLCHEVG